MWLLHVSNVATPRPISLNKSAHDCQGCFTIRTLGKRVVVLVRMILLIVKCNRLQGNGRIGSRLIVASNV